MKTGVISAVLCVALGVAVIGQTISLRETRQELAEVRSKLEQIESRQKSTLAGADRALDEVREQIAKVEKKAAEPRPAVSAPAGKPDALPTFVSEEDIQKIVDDRIEERLKAKGDPRKPGLGGERKLPLHDLAKELALDPKTQAKVAEIANTAKREIFDLLKTPRADGTTVADELIDTVTKGDQAAMQQFFQKLLTETIPGTATTYIAGVGAVQDRARQLLQSTMGTEAYGRFEHMNLKPENIETGFDPLAEYFKQRQRK